MLYFPLKTVISLANQKGFLKEIFSLAILFFFSFFLSIYSLLIVFLSIRIIEMFSNKCCSST